MKQTLKRYFYIFEMSDLVTLEGREHHHLANVVRSKVGEHVILFNGDNYDYEYQITAITRDSATLRYAGRAKNKANPTAHVSVFLGLIKPDNLGLVVEKLNELGVGNLYLFTTERTNTNAKSVNVDKLQMIANQSCKQCGRSTPLLVKPIITFEKMLVGTKHFDQVFYADRGERRDKLFLQTLDKDQNVAIIIGPEGGMSLEENLAITQNAEPITLGTRTLRSETAAIVASTIVLHKLGEI